MIPKEDDPVLVAETTTIVQQSGGQQDYNSRGPAMDAVQDADRESGGQQDYNSRAPAMDAVQDADHESSQSPEERLIEKERMIALVRQFVRQARKGVTCKLLDAAVGTQTVTSITLSRENGLLVLDGFDEKKIRLAHMTDASMFKDLPRPPKAAQLSAETAACCARLRSSEPGQGGEIEVYVIFDTQLDAERFVTCLHILRLYAENLKLD